jgi:amicyanin
MVMPVEFADRLFKAAMKAASKTAARTAARAVAKAALALAAVLAIAASVPAAHAEEPTVKIDNFTFNPPSLTVTAGATVTWMNEDDIPHTVASATRAFKSKALDTDDSYTFTFTTPGVYEYFCSLHPHMTGKIVVEAKTGSK